MAMDAAMKIILRFALISGMLMFGPSCQYFPFLSSGTETGEISTPSEKAGQVAIFLANARLKGHSIAIVGEEEADGMHSFSVLNISNRTIKRVEIFFFALDENGQKIPNSLSAGREALEENLVISEQEGTIKPGYWGDAQIKSDALPGWKDTRFTGYRITFEDGAVMKSSAPSSEYVLNGVDAAEASRALRMYDEKSP